MSANECIDCLIKIIICFFLTSVIGLQRSANNKPAGFGTHVIIGISSTLIVLASTYMSKYYDMDASRIPAQLLAGVGFIGAGAILTNGVNVKGITTAASIFAVTCIGIAVGTGYYFGAILATLIIFLMLVFSHDFSDRFDHYEDVTVTININNKKNDTIKNIEKLLKQRNINILGIHNKNNIVKLSLNFDSNKINNSDILELLNNIKDISDVEIDID